MSDAPKPSPAPGGQFLVYQTADGKLKIDVRFEGETVWLTQQQMAELLQTSKQNVSLHIQNVFSEGELAEVSVVKESLTTAADGKNYATKFYNLDVIEISTHFNSKQRVFLEFVLSQYVKVGVDELATEKLSPLLKLKYNNAIADAIADLGQPEDIGRV